ncbi:MAG: hypothetical protein M3R30_03790 [Candidatus Eremiobacteraeota bacterium]|nr:hypothetical protein [Candidatus Eremiobacteraeota bacterium]
MKLGLTRTNLSTMLIAMPVAILALVALAIVHNARPEGWLAVFVSVYVACALVLCGGMFVGAAVVWKAQRDTPSRRVFALATTAERVVWIGGSVVAFLIAVVLLVFAIRGDSWASAFQPVTICALAVPSIAMISAGRRVLTDSVGD